MKKILVLFTCNLFILLLFYSCENNSNILDNTNGQHFSQKINFLEEEPFFSETVSFEEDFDGWSSDHYITPPKVLEWEINRTDDESYDEDYSLEFYVNGEHDDGTIWVEKSFSYSGESESVVAVLEFYSSSSTNNSQASQVVAFADWRYEPEEESDFDYVGLYPVNGIWYKFTYETEIEIYPQYEGRIWLAFGINCITTTNQTYYFDYVSVKLYD